MRLSKNIQVFPVGDSAVEIRFGETIDRLVNQRVYEFERIVQEEKIAGISHTIPAYSSLLVQYDPLLLEYHQIQQWLRKLLQKKQRRRTYSGKDCGDFCCLWRGIWTDLGYVARVHQIPEQDVCSSPCRKSVPGLYDGIYPGFAYLGGLNPALATPGCSSPGRSFRLDRWVLRVCKRVSIQFNPQVDGRSSAGLTPACTIPNGRIPFC